MTLQTQKNLQPQLAQIYMLSNIIFYFVFTFWARKKLHNNKAITLLHAGVVGIQLQIIFLGYSIALLHFAFRIKVIWIIVFEIISISLWNVYFYSRSKAKLQEMVSKKKDSNAESSKNNRTIPIFLVVAWTIFLFMFGQYINSYFLYTLMGALSYMAACSMAIGIQSLYNYRTYYKIS